MNLVVLILWVIIGVMNFIHFWVDIKKNDNSELKYYFWQYLLAWFAVITFLASRVV